MNPIRRLMNRRVEDKKTHVNVDLIAKERDGLRKLLRDAEHELNYWRTFKFTGPCDATVRDDGCWQITCKHEHGATVVIIPKDTLAALKDAALLVYMPNIDAIAQALVSKLGIDDLRATNVALSGDLDRTREDLDRTREDLSRVRQGFEQAGATLKQQGAQLSRAKSAVEHLSNICDLWEDSFRALGQVTVGLKDDEPVNTVAIFDAIEKKFIKKQPAKRGGK